MKDSHVVSFSPLRHWTEQKIRVHVFYCVLALAVAHLLRRQAAQAGLEMSVRELLDTWRVSRRPSCSTRATVAGPEPDACSPT